MKPSTKKQKNSTVEHTHTHTHEHRHNQFDGLGLRTSNYFLSSRLNAFTASDRLTATRNNRSQRVWFFIAPFSHKHLFFCVWILLTPLFLSHREGSPSRILTQIHTGIFPLFFLLILNCKWFVDPRRVQSLTLESCHKKNPKKIPFFCHLRFCISFFFPLPFNPPSLSTLKVLKMRYHVCLFSSPKERTRRRKKNES